MITLANWISKIILTKFAAYRREETYSKQIYEETFSMMSVEVLNAGILPFYIAWLGTCEVYEELDSEGNRKPEFLHRIYEKGGLIEEISFVLLIMLFGDALKQITKPWYIGEKFKRLCCLKKKKDEKNITRVTNMTQAELNKQYTKLMFNP